MENVILGLFIGIPAALLIAALAAWYRTNQQFEIEES
jgi:hypothetical protein